MDRPFRLYAVACKQYSEQTMETSVYITEPIRTRGIDEEKELERSNLPLRSAMKCRLQLVIKYLYNAITHLYDFNNKNEGSKCNIRRILKDIITTFIAKQIIKIVILGVSFALLKNPRLTIKIFSSVDVVICFLPQ